MATSKAIDSHVQPTNPDDFESFFEELPCAVLVLGEDLRLISFNKAAFEHMYEGTQEVLRVMVGDAIGCVNAFQGCGTTPACRECGLRRTAEESLRTGDSACVLAPMTIRRGERHAQVLFLMATNCVDRREGKLVLLTLQDLSELRGAEAGVCGPPRSTARPIRD